MYAITLSTKLAEDVGVKVGDWVTIRYGEKDGTETGRWWGCFMTRS